MNKLVKRILGTIAVTAAVALSGFLLPETGLLPDLSVTASADTEFTEAATWDELKEALTADGNVRLTDDVTAGDGDTALEVPSGKTVTLDLNGYTLDRGLKDKFAVEDGNVIMVNGNLTLADSSTGKTGTITGGNNSSDGGGVYVNGTFTMNGGKISGCSTYGNGGVYVSKDGKFTMSGGTISGCSAYGDGGGGVCVDNGATFTMSGGTISGCSAYGYGGGVYVDNSATFTMSGGTISGCSANIGGGGVCVDYGTFNVSGSPVISGNTKDGTANNVEFDSYHPTKTINVTDELTKGASIYVNAGNGSTVAVGGGYTLKASDAEYFHSDIDAELPSVLVTDDNTNKVKFAGEWGILQSKLDNASTDETSPTKITLSGDVKAEDGDTTLEVKSGTYVILDLNGHTIDRGLTSKANYGNVIKVNGNLTLKDSSTGKTGTITGGKTTGNGGGVNVNGGEFTMQGGTISGCSTDYIGGGVCVLGTFTMQGGTISGCSAKNGGGVYVMNGEFAMSGGTISGCSATDNGGGVYAYGIFTMSGGTISECKTTDDNGGGVYVSGDGTFTMSGGTISECKTTDGNGGGVYVDSVTHNTGGGVDVHSGTFNVSGAPVISGNTAGGTANNVVFASTHPTKTLNVIGALTKGASIYVNAGKDDAVAVGSGYTLKASDAEYFHSDSDGLASVLVTEDNKVKFTDAWGALQSKLNNASKNETSPTKIKLSGNVTAKDDDTALEVKSGTYVILDLNGHTIDRGLTSPTSGGNVITVNGNLTLTDSSDDPETAEYDGTGIITGGKTTGFGGGVYVENGAKFTMSGGTISGCSTRDISGGGDGGGVFVKNGGEFTMTGGTISGCSTDYIGGGVCVLGTFTMQGGTISGCSAKNGGGVYVMSGEFAMKGGTISGCSATDNGGGVYAYGIFTMSGGTLSECKTTDDNGGGVYVSGDGTFTMSGGTISECKTTDDNGGGVYVDSVTHNTGGGVDVHSGTFNVSGAPVISGNTAGDAANNVEFASDHPTKTINVIGELTTDAEIYVTAGKDSEVAVGSDSYTLTALDAECFHSDSDGLASVLVTEDNKVKFTDAWGALQSKLNNASKNETSPTKIKLSGNVTAEDGDTALEVKSGTYVTLDLNGHTIDRGLKGKDAVEDGNVIKVYGNLTLKDSSTGGTITGGKTTGYGGGVYVNGTFTMSDGTISGCSATRYGGGVFVENGATFTMSGGTISGCSATRYGGGVCVYKGTFTMSGGTISGCSTTGDGGGVYVEFSATFNMSGGTISGCDAATGGGVYVFTKGTFNVSGSPVISDNTKGNAANNVEFNSTALTKTINVTGVLTKGASVYVHAGKDDAVAVGGGSYTLKASDAEYFHSDYDGLASVFVTEDNKNKVKFVGAWGALKSKLDNASTDENDPTTITLSGDVTAEDGDTALVVPAGKYVTLDLNGKTIDRGLKGEGKNAVEGGNVITVNGNLTLTDSSDNPETAEYDGTGIITGGYNSDNGGGVLVNGTFTMSGGTISNCSTDNTYGGGGVCVSGDGTFTMTGGTISGCSAKYGGGVYVNNGGTFTMTGGTISGCLADSGGGVYVRGTFTMTGGTISDCSTSYGCGGGVCVNGIFTMTGGTISGCSAYMGDGVYVCEDGTFNVSGSPVISGNNRGYDTNNVEFASEHPTKTINVTGALATGASIYVTAEKGDAVAVGSGYTLTESDAEYFHSDYDGLASALDNGKIVFKAALPVPDNIKSVTYNGNAQSPELSFGGETLKEGTDYTVTCKLGDTVVTETKNAGTYTVIVTGIGAYAGTYEKSYTIDKKPVTVSGIKAENKIYDGTTDAKLDYTGVIFDGIYAGDTLTVTATGTFEDANFGTGKTVNITDITLVGTRFGNYILAENGQQTIAKANIEKANKPANTPSAYMTASIDAQTLADVVLPDDWEWKEPTTQLSDEAPVYGVADYTAADKDNYVTTTVTITVCRKELMVIGIENASYTGKAITQNGLKVLFRGKELNPKTDYTVSYKDNTKAGTATVTITGKGNFAAKITETFEIRPAEFTGDEFTVEDITLKFTGRDQKKIPAFKWNGKTVPAAGYDIIYCAYDTTVDTDEPVAVTSFKESYAVLFDGKGNFAGKKIAKVTILNDDSVLVNTTTIKLNKTTFTLATDANDQGCVVPVITVTKGKTAYVEDVDYELTFVDNDKVGTASVIITGKGGTLSGSVTKTFKINAVSLSTATVTGVVNKTFDPSIAGGMTQTGYVVKAKDGTELTEDVDYTVSYKNNIKAGNAQIIFTGIGKYNGTKSVTFKIDKAEIKAEDIVCAESVEYCKSGAKPKITVTVNGETLVLGTDYTVAYAKNTKLNSDKSAAATITGKGNYSGKVVCNYKVKAAEITDGDGSLTVTVADQIYNGTAKTKLSSFIKAPTVKDTEGKALSKGTDFEKVITYSISADGTSFTEITDADLKTNLNDLIAAKFPTLDYAANGLTIKVEITLKGNYSGTYSGTYRIATTNISTVKTTVADQTFTGEEIVFDPSSADFSDIFEVYVMVGKVRTKLVYGVDFEIVPGSYEKNIKKGTASVMIRGLGKYAGTKKVSFKIVAKAFEN